MPGEFIVSRRCFEMRLFGCFECMRGCKVGASERKRAAHVDGIARAPAFQVLFKSHLRGVLPLRSEDKLS